MRACLVAGVGFFTDAYDIFAINIASTMIGFVYNQGVHAGKLTSNQDLGLKVATPVGTLVGQLLFGYLADVYGRKKVRLVTELVARTHQADHSSQMYGIEVRGTHSEALRFCLNLSIAAHDHHRRDWCARYSFALDLPSSVPLQSDKRSLATGPECRFSVCWSCGGSSWEWASVVRARRTARREET